MFLHHLEYPLKRLADVVPYFLQGIALGNATGKTRHFRPIAALFGFMDNDFDEHSTTLFHESLDGRGPRLL
jgi:hypothetical protein